MNPIRALIERWPASEYAMAAASGTDYEHEAEALYAVCRQAVPRRVLELGVRYGVSARIIVAALLDSDLHSEFVAVDPEPASAEVAALPLRYVRATGQEFFEGCGKFDLIHIDTDPHSYVQTVGWMETYAKTALTPGGVLAFHDFNDHSGVQQAVREWCKRELGWRLEVQPSLNGFAALWKAAHVGDVGSSLSHPHDGDSGR